jgi:hypothetical protein
MPRRYTRFAFEPPIYTFRVRILGGFYAPANGRDIWREIEIAANQPLSVLGEAIPLAFDFSDPHLWSFFLSGKAWDEQTEYGMRLPYGENPPHDAGATPIRDLPLPGTTGKKEFLFYFDYGDGWEFGVKLVRTSQEMASGEMYPRIATRQGESPPQYPPLDDEDGDDWGDFTIIVPGRADT